MSQTDLFALTGVALLCIGLRGLVLRPHFLHKIIALNLSGVGSFFLFIAVARRVPGDVPDPIPHSMVLTGIVVTVAMTALAVALAKRIVSETGATSFDELDGGDDA